MRAPILLLSALVILGACKQESSIKADAEKTQPRREKAHATLLRSIRFYGTNDDFGIELNGSDAFVRIESEELRRIEMPYEEGRRLLEGFYAISGIENYRGKASDDRQTSIHYLVNIYDMLPERWSDEWVDYVIPKDRVPQDPELREWFSAMHAARKKAEETATRTEMKSENSDKLQPEAERPSR